MAKIKKNKVKKLSKTEKSIANKVAYQRRKIKELKNEMIKTREDANFNPEQKIKDENGDLKMQKTIEAELANKATKINKKILQLELKREKRFKKYKRKTTAKSIENKIKNGKFEISGSYTAWEQKDFLADFILSDYEKVNNKKVISSLDEIIDEVIDAFLSMSSEHLLTAFVDDNYIELIYEITYDPDGVKEKRG